MPSEIRYIRERSCELSDDYDYDYLISFPGCEDWDLAKKKEDSFIDQAEAAVRRLKPGATKIVRQSCHIVKFGKLVVVHPHQVLVNSAITYEDNRLKSLFNGPKRGTEKITEYFNARYVQIV